MIASILSTLGGALFGATQNVIEHHQNNKKDIEIVKLQNEKDIEIAKIQSTQVSIQNEIQQSKTQEAQYVSDAQIKDADTNEYKAFSDAVTQQTTLWQSNSKAAIVANFIICTTRPFITYILLFLVCGVSMKILTSNDIVGVQIDGQSAIVVIFDLILAEFSAVMSYWFVRRSFEKKKS